MIGMIGIPIIERPRDWGIDGGTCSDDSTKYPKAYCQTLSTLGKTPSRDVSFSDISNVHLSLLECRGKSNHHHFGGPITVLLTTETTNLDTIELTVINVILTIDG